MSRMRSLRTVSTRSYVACEVGEAIYILPVEQVQEIIQPMHLTSLPHAPPGVIGAVEHRDVVVPILDLGERLGYGKTMHSRRKWVLLKGRDRSLGIVVSQVHEVFEAPESKLRPAPEVGDTALRGAKQVIQYRDTMAFLLDWSAVAKLAEMVNVEPSLEESMAR